MLVSEAGMCHWPLSDPLGGREPRSGHSQGRVQSCGLKPAFSPDKRPLRVMGLLSSPAVTLRPTAAPCGGTTAAEAHEGDSPLQGMQGAKRPQTSPQPQGGPAAQTDPHVLPDKCSVHTCGAVFTRLLRKYLLSNYCALAPRDGQGPSLFSSCQRHPAQRWSVTRVTRGVCRCILVWLEFRSGQRGTRRARSLSVKQADPLWDAKPLVGLLNQVSSLVRGAGASWTASILFNEHVGDRALGLAT